MQHIGSSIKNKRILLAEDCEDSREILKFLFSKSGAEVEAVSNGSECVDRALNAYNQHNPFDIVVVDVHMPILDGNGAAKKLRSEGYTLPIVAITGQTTEEEKQQCLSSGCDAFMSKLSPKETMLDVLEALLPKEDVDFGIPALPFIPKLLETNPEYAPLMLKFINGLSAKLLEMGKAIESKSWKDVASICGSLSSSSFYGYQIFAEKLGHLQQAIEDQDREEIAHNYRMLKQSAKSIILGVREIEKVANRVRN